MKKLLGLIVIVAVGYFAYDFFFSENKQKITPPVPPISINSQPSQHSRQRAQPPQKSYMTDLIKLAKKYNLTVLNARENPPGTIYLKLESNSNTPLVEFLTGVTRSMNLKDIEGGKLQARTNPQGRRMFVVEHKFVF